MRGVLFTIDNECDRMLKEIEKKHGKGKKSRFVREAIKHYYNIKYSDTQKIPEDVESRLTEIQQKTAINSMILYFKKILKGNKKEISKFSDKLRTFWDIDPEFVTKVTTLGVTINLHDIDKHFKDACAWTATKKELSEEEQTVYETLLEMRLYPKTMLDIREAIQKNELVIKIVQDKVYIK